MNVSEAMNKPAKTNFEKEFSKIVGFLPKFDNLYRAQLDSLLEYLSKKKIRPIKQRRTNFIALINKKFELNAVPLAEFYFKAAKLGHTFNFHQKNAIQKAYDSHDKKGLVQILKKDKKIKKEVFRILVDLFNPISEAETIKYLQQEIKEPSKLRIEKGSRDIASEILKALFSAFLWVSLSEKEMHRYFDPEFSDKNYQESFLSQLQVRSPHLFNRDNALSILKVNQKLFRQDKDIDSERNRLLSVVSEIHGKLNNYGFFAAVIEPVVFKGRSIEWEIVSDLILFAEKFKETELRKGYFQWEKIKRNTTTYIDGIDEAKARFDLVNEGFTYRDTFILRDSNGSIEKAVVLFQKNERDETLIPCPACRSNLVQGNSYSSFGVKSWECDNQLCPDRSKYNRGKRYSFRGLLMQEAIMGESNMIPIDSVRKWQRDVVDRVNDDELFEMLVRHYSMQGDSVRLLNWKSKKKSYLGRKIIYENLEIKGRVSLRDLHIFDRYLVSPKSKKADIKNLGDKDFQVYAEDAAAALANFPNNTFDGAITSPPYFNAREYSQWSNIYCYLHDMFSVNREVFRTLKPGAIYLYNIFDYFDNENTIALSAMGQKRMILSAYTVDMFRRIGFELVGNIAWDKGEIEGKRGFNAGNFSPFYQAPFNCWEHILIFRKPGMSSVEISSSVFSCKPVMKMVKGKNTHGHTAPFPDALPEILISRLTAGSLVLDPFAGSLTTGRVAEELGVKSVNIEISKEYCKLGISKRKKSPKGLFQPARARRGEVKA